MSNSEPSQPEPALADVSPTKASESDGTPASSGARSSRSSIRPAPADWEKRPRSGRPPPSPMVVVYSGESTDATWDAGAPSDRPTFAHFAPAPREFSESPRGSVHVTTDPGEAALEPDAEPRARAEADAGTAKARELPASGRATRPASGKKPRLPLVVAGCLGLSVIGLLLVPQGPDRAPVATPEGERAARPEPSVDQEPLRASAVLAVPAQAPEPKPAATAAPEASAAAPAPEPTHHRHVTLEVFPPDAKVVRRGVRQPGPPYEFELPPGKRLAFEVAKKGYVTRKVVLNGKEARVWVGLVAKAAHASK